MTTMVCAGCGWTAPALDPAPFRCPRAGDDVDHVMQRRLREVMRADDDPHPFVRYRKRTHAWNVAMQLGISDAEFVAIVRSLNQPFRFTPFELDDALGVWVKNETANVARSHKARHLMGLMIWLRIAERIDPNLAQRPFAIASCGNAAMAAATIARSAARELHVFIPADANENVVAKLEALGAKITHCPRRAGERGDPAYLRFREAVADGALPFTCQGNENGLAIEGGETLGWELIEQAAERGVVLDRIVIQVGGGALASAVIAAFDDARVALPRIDAVQTAAAYPLKRAYDKVVERCDLKYAVTHRSQFMWPWETEPRSVATGILDDETYDWAAVVRGMIASGGEVVVVAEEQLVEANRLAGARVSCTGSAGLAGVLALRAAGAIRPDEKVCVLFTGDGRARGHAGPRARGAAIRHARRA